MRVCCKGRSARKFELLFDNFLIESNRKVYKERVISSFMSHAEVAKQRMQILMESINNAVEPDIEKLISLSCFEWGTTRKTIQGYLRILKEAGMITI